MSSPMASLKACMFLAALLPVGVVKATAATSETATSHDYCIVGAGAAGLQLGHLMMEMGMDYKTFERAEVAGNFFTQFPIHRRLISVNKKFTGRRAFSVKELDEYNLRHDWNSLIHGGHGHAPHVVPITNRSNDRFPLADVLAEYLQDFAKPQVEAGNIQFHTEVAHITRLHEIATTKSGEKVKPFLLELKQGVRRDYRGAGADGHIKAEGNSTFAKCKVVVMASGLWEGHRLSVYGVEHAYGYETVPANPNHFAGKNVAILGLGNAAFEVADVAQQRSNFVHQLCTRVGSCEVKPSWETRYVGSVRATRPGMLDGHELKSLDYLPVADVMVAAPTTLVMTPCGELQEDGKPPVCFWGVATPMPTAEMKAEDLWLSIEEVNKESDLGGKFLQLLKSKCAADTVELSNSAHCATDVMENNGFTPESFTSNSGGQSTKLQLSDSDWKSEATCNHNLTKAEFTVSCFERFSTSERQLTSDLREFIGVDFFRAPYHTVVSATGWQHDVRPYGRDVLPKLQHNLKYPQMTSEYESVNVAGMFFAGSPAHGKDHKRSAGGFVHGLRYTARALYRQLAEKYEGKRWAKGYREFDVGSAEGIEAMAQHVDRRIHEASGPWQLPQVLGDAWVHLDGTKVGYYEEMPLEHLNTKYPKRERGIWMYYFNGQHRSYSNLEANGANFAPILMSFPADTTGDVRYRTSAFRSMADLAGEHKCPSSLHALDPPLQWTQSFLGEDVNAQYKSHWKMTMMRQMLHQLAARLKSPAAAPAPWRSVPAPDFDDVAPEKDAPIALFRMTNPVDMYITNPANAVSSVQIFEPRSEKRVSLAPGETRKLPLLSGDWLVATALLDEEAARLESRPTSASFLHSTTASAAWCGGRSVILQAFYGNGIRQEIELPSDVTAAAAAGTEAGQIPKAS